MANETTDARNMTAEDQRFIEKHKEGLSDTVTKYARWIHSPDEHEERPGQTLATRSHEVIQRWADERGARPATVEGSGPEDRAGVLRLDFPDYGGQDLKPIDWEAWFEPFDERELVFIFQEHKKDGDTSNFFQLEYPGNAQS